MSVFMAVVSYLSGAWAGVVIIPSIISFFLYLFNRIRGIHSSKPIPEIIWIVFSLGLNFAIVKMTGVDNIVSFIGGIIVSSIFCFLMLFVLSQD